MLPENKRIALMNVQPGRKRLVIDTDAKNEVDDQFAIAWAQLSRADFDLEALYAVPFSHDCFRKLNEDAALVDIASEMNGHSESPADGMEQSYEEIRKLLALMNESFEGRVFRGSAAYLPDDGSYIDSEAARDLIERSKRNGLLYVAAIGTLTNIASALMMDPSLADRMVLVWLGGHMQSFGHGIEFNLIQDVRAAQTVLDSGVPMIWIPCDNVASHLTVSKSELEEYLLGTTPVADYLAQTVLNAFRNPQADIAMMQLLRTSSLRGNNDQPEEYLSQFPTEHIAWSRIIWDISAVAALKNPNWTPSMLIPAPVLNRDFTWSSAPADRHSIRVITYCYRNMIFGDLFETIAAHH